MNEQPEKWWRFELRVEGHREPMVDWYYAETEAVARLFFDEDCHRYGIPMERATVTVREATPEEYAAFQW